MKDVRSEDIIGTIKNLEAGGVIEHRIDGDYYTGKDGKGNYKTTCYEYPDVDIMIPFDVDYKDYWNLDTPIYFIENEHKIDCYKLLAMGLNGDRLPHATKPISSSWFYSVPRFINHRKILAQHFGLEKIWTYETLYSLEEKKEKNSDNSSNDEKYIKKPIKVYYEVNFDYLLYSQCSSIYTKAFNELARNSDKVNIDYYMLTEEWRDKALSYVEELRLEMKKIVEEHNEFIKTLYHDIDKFGRYQFWTFEPRYRNSMREKKELREYGVKLFNYNYVSIISVYEEDVSKHLEYLGKTGDIFPNKDYNYLLENDQERIAKYAEQWEVLGEEGFLKKLKAELKESSHPYLYSYVFGS